MRRLRSSEGPRAAACTEGKNPISETRMNVPLHANRNCVAKLLIQLVERRHLGAGVSKSGARSISSKTSYRPMPSHRCAPAQLRLSRSSRRLRRAWVMPQFDAAVALQRSDAHAESLSSLTDAARKTRNASELSILNGNKTTANGSATDCGARASLALRGCVVGRKNERAAKARVS